MRILILISSFFLLGPSCFGQPRESITYIRVIGDNGESILFKESTGKTKLITKTDTYRKKRSYSDTTHSSKSYGFSSYPGIPKKIKIKNGSKSMIITIKNHPNNTTCVVIDAIQFTPGRYELDFNKVIKNEEPHSVFGSCMHIAPSNWNKKKN